MKNYVGGEFPESYYAQCVTFLAVTGPGEWRARYGNREYPVRGRVPGTVEFDLPRGSSGALVLRRA